MSTWSITCCAKSTHSFSFIRSFVFVCFCYESDSVWRGVRNQFPSIMRCRTVLSCSLMRRRATPTALSAVAVHHNQYSTHCNSIHQPKRLAQGSLCSSVHNNCILQSISLSPFHCRRAHQNACSRAHGHQYRSFRSSSRVQSSNAVPDWVPLPPNPHAVMMKAFIGLGSNVGDRLGYFRKALQLLNENGCTVTQTSSAYASPLSTSCNDAANLVPCSRV